MTMSSLRAVRWLWGSQPVALAPHQPARHSDLDAAKSGPATPPARFLCYFVSFIVPATLATNYTVNRFYTLGAAMWDSGWFAYLASSGLKNPPALGGWFLADHMSFVLGILALFHELTPSTAAPVFFAFTQGLWFGVIGLAASLCLTPLLPPLASVPLAILCALNGISLATIGFPHIEIAIPALVLLILALWVRHHRIAACLLVPLLLAVREDAGLHLATVFALLAAWRWRRTGDWRAGRAEAMLAGIGIAASAISFLVQQALFVHDIDQLHDTYLGTPAFAHLDWALMRHRFYRLAQNRSYIYLPCFLTLAIAARQRRWALAIGPLAGVPWIAMTLVARSPQAGELMSYYGFPLMIGLCWPMIAARLEAGPGHRRVALRLLAANVLVSIALFTVSGGMHDGRPWENFGPPDTARIAATEAALDEILSHRHEIGPFVVDDAVGALRPSGFHRSELRLDGVHRGGTQGPQRHGLLPNGVAVRPQAGDHRGGWPVHPLPAPGHPPAALQPVAAERIEPAGTG